MNKVFIDQLHREVKINFPPKRIISLVPSQTELLIDLGLENELVAITRFCIHPKHIFETKIKVGGTKNYKLDKIRALKPDLIIANKEENDKESLEALAKEFPVWISDIKTLEDAFEMIKGIGKISNTKVEAEKMLSVLKKQFNELDIYRREKKVVYLIWKDPFMTISQDTFIHDILKRAGFQNAFANLEGRYPEISLEDIKAQKPDYIFLSSEPYPFKTKHIAWFQENLPNVKVRIVDGEMFSWYGSRLLKVVDYISTICFK